ncbi:MAG: 7,8-dihydroneopterin aldolase/epimerase/oxygenase [Frankiaceae bacterium]|jgi:dihydroneopterin aldolase|nr:7,8-dihydroneopterin aldolase/epimerase/oxygenase [Frankiaceae bacterium]
MSDRIVLRGLRVRGYHGVLPAERRDGQLFGVDVTIETDVGPAADADDLALTVDYGVVARQVERIVAGDPVDLLETLAVRIADACLAHRGVTAVEVTVHKPTAPIGIPFDDVAVTVRRSR